MMYFSQCTREPDPRFKELCFSDVLLHANTAKGSLLVIQTWLSGTSEDEEPLSGLEVYIVQMPTPEFRERRLIKKHVKKRFKNTINEDDKHMRHDDNLKYTLPN